MSEYKPTEYVVDFGDYRSNQFVRLNMALIEQNGAKLGERIVRCRDCAKADYAEVHMFDGTRQKKWTCTRFGCFHHMVKPDDFCSRGARREP